MATKGYSDMALLMSHNPETAIFRAFKMLNAQNLLYLQAELTELELELNMLREKDKTSEHLYRKKHHQNWYLLSHSKRDGDDAQWKKSLDVRIKLREYNECLAHFILLCEQKRPSKYDLGVLNTWREHEHLGNFPLCGTDRNIWDDSTILPDLIAISKRQESDAFSRLFVDRVLPIFHSVIGKYFKHPSAALGANGAISEYSDGHIFAVLKVINTMIACFLPVSSVIVLYFVPSISIRLGIVVAYEVVFSFCLAMFTCARRVEIFATVAAFAAVQVVFISATTERV